MYQDYQYVELPRSAMELILIVVLVLQVSL